jgi:hypothetical protein
MNLRCTRARPNARVTPAVHKQLGQGRNINMSKTRKQLSFCNAAMSVIAALSLTACGGGGDGAQVTTAGAGNQIAPAPAPTSTAPAPAPAASPAAAPSPAPAPSASAEFVVAAGSAGVPDLARLSDGGHVVVWMAGARTVCTQRFQADGSLAGAEACIGSNVVSEIRGPSVAALADGGYLVAWSAAVDTGFFPKLIQAQRYDASGAAVGGVQQVNDLTTDVVTDVNVAALAGGGYALAWRRGGEPDTTAPVIVAKVYGADGMSTRPEKTVNTGAINDIAALGGGGYVIVRSDEFGAVFVARYDNQGAQLGAELRVFDNGGAHAAVTSLAGGGFAVGGGARATDGLLVQRFASDGSPVGAPMPVDSPVPILSCSSRAGVTPCPAFQADLDLAGLDDGGYVATWLANPDSAILGGQKVFARRFAAGGAPAGPVVQISSLTGFDPSIATLPGGIVAITWDQGTAGEVFERRVDVQSMLGGTTP